jgi:hypothetical protein
MVKQLSLDNDVPKRSHIDPILRKYIWVDTQNKKYIKEKNQFKQVTKYKGQYIIKKQKARSAIVKGGSAIVKGGKLHNTCNEPTDKVFFYKTDFTHGSEEYNVYFIYYTDGIDNAKNPDEGLNESCSTLYGDVEHDTKSIVGNSGNISNNTTHHIYREKGTFYNGKYKILSLPQDEALTFIDKHYKKVLILKIAIYTDNKLEKTFYIRFNPIKPIELVDFKKLKSKYIEASNDVDNSSINVLEKYMNNLTVKVSNQSEAQRIASLNVKALSDKNKTAEAEVPLKSTVEEYYNNRSGEELGGGYRQIPKNKKSVLNNFIKSLMLIGNANNKKKASKPDKPAKDTKPTKPTKSAKATKATKVAAPRDKKVAKKVRAK